MKVKNASSDIFVISLWNAGSIPNLLNTEAFNDKTEIHREVEYICSATQETVFTSFLV